MTLTPLILFGDDLLSQKRNSTVSNYHYDGLGSTRNLTDSTGNVTDSYFYDAFGVTLATEGSTENDYLFTGEQYDAGLGNYYLRARYYDQGVGRFTQQDTWMGINHDPVTLHKYLYANADPVSYTDPTGNFSMGQLATAMNVMGTLATIASTSYNVFQIATGEKEFSAKEFAINLLLSRLPINTVRKILTKICPTNSFDGETMVATEIGLVAIKNIKIGDKVWAYNEQTGENSLQEVVHLIVGEGEKDLVDINLGSGEVIQATAGHPFYVMDQDSPWVDAKNLTKIDMLLGLGGEQVSIESALPYKKKVKVYNLTVANNHTFYVGESRVLSHNVQKVCPIKGLIFGAKKPNFEPNPKHTKGGGGSKGNLPKGLEPEDSLYAFQKNAVKSENGHWYAKSSDGKSIYRYFENNGVAHWSGNTGDKTAPLKFAHVPPGVLKAFGFKPNGKLQ